MGVLVVGCGIIGAMIAYELSKIGVEVTVYEAQSGYGNGASGSALGVLMAVCSAKGQGDITQLRLASLSRFDGLISELPRDIPYNKTGILCLYEQSSAKAKYADLIKLRQTQGFPLTWQDQVEGWRCAGGMYSPCDRWVHPQQLISALVTAAEAQGAKFYFHKPLKSLAEVSEQFDYVVLTAGLGANQVLHQELLQPVRGLAVEVDLPDFHLETVVHAVNDRGEDINVVPLANHRYWIGGTVRFDPDQCEREKDTYWLMAEAMRFQPCFENAEVVGAWIGDRPRPRQQKAPIIGFLPYSSRILVAVGHYRNGVLMAPISAQIIKDLILHGKSDLPWQSFSPQIRSIS